MIRRIFFLTFLSAFVHVAFAQAVPQFARATETAMRKRLIHLVEPGCPGGSRRIQGSVVFNATIGKTGKVENLQTISGHPLLIPLAIEAVRQWTYKPLLFNGNPLIVETQIHVDFHCSANPPPQGVVGDHPGGIPPGGIAPSTGSTEPIPPINPIPNGVRVAPPYVQKRLLRRVSPEYPAQAKAQHIEGQVVLEVIIDKQGSVTNVQLVSGHPILAPAAINAVKQWKYEPYLLNNKPVEVETQVEVTFSLKK